MAAQQAKQVSDVAPRESSEEPASSESMDEEIGANVRLGSKLFDDSEDDQPDAHKKVLSLLKDPDLARDIII
jgi:cytochrome c peroxidase